MKQFHEEWEDVAKTDKAHQAIAATNYQNESIYNMSGIITSSELLKIVSRVYKEKCADMTLVEIGCGTGRETKYLADCFRRVVALDTSPTMIQKAKERVKKGNIVFIRNKSATIPMEEKEADMVYSFIVFQHCKADMVIRYFKEAHRVLKEGGRFIFQLGCSKNEDREPKNYGDVGMRNAMTLLSDLKRAGFSKVLINSREHFGLHIATK
jgi:ubiquinone/menaquinone biosynthesis C-methylase UbiE